MEKANFDLIEESKKWIGVVEEGNNSGTEVEMFQKAVDGKANHESWCFEGDVEILTTNGFVKFKDLQDDAIVAQVKDDLNIEFVKPLEFIRKQYTGKGFHVLTRSLDFICDEGHRFYGRFNNCKNPEFDTLDRVSHSLQIPNIYSNFKGCGLNKEELGLLAVFLSDGFIGTTRCGAKRIFASVSKDREKNQLEELNPISKYNHKKTYGISKEKLSQFGFEIPWFFDDLFNSYKEMKWEFVLSFNTDEARYFLSIYENFDGNRRQNSVRLFSSNRVLADQLAYLAAISGYTVNESVQYSPLSSRPNYIIQYAASDNKQSRTIRSEHINKIDIVNQTLYCVSVPSRRIIIRDKNHSILMTGNCMAFVQYCVKQVEQATGSASCLFKSEHCLTVWNKTPAYARRTAPEAGLICIWRHGDTTNGHTGVVIGLDEDNPRIFLTVEGNTGNGPDVVREGDGVYMRSRLKNPNGSMKIVGFLDPFATPSVKTNTEMPELKQIEVKYATI